MPRQLHSRLIINDYKAAHDPTVVQAAAQDKRTAEPSADSDSGHEPRAAGTTTSSSTPNCVVKARASHSLGDGPRSSHHRPHPTTGAQPQPADMCQAEIAELGADAGAHGCSRFKGGVTWSQLSLLLQAPGALTLFDATGTVVLQTEAAAGMIPCPERATTAGCSADLASLAPFASARLARNSILWELFALCPEELDALLYCVTQGETWTGGCIYIIYVYSGSMV